MMSQRLSSFLRNPIWVEIMVSLQNFSRAAVAIAFFSNHACGFIPSIPSILESLFEGRRAGQTSEFVLRHQITLEGGDAVDIEERIIMLKDVAHFLFSGRQLSGQLHGTIERGSYALGNRQVIPSRSGIFRSYLFGTQPERLQDRLIREEFIYRDQLQQFKPGFVLQGDPKLWDLKGNYLRHQDIYLQRLPAGVAISVRGLNKGDMKRSLYFDKAFRGILRTEWVEGQNVIAWNYDGFVKDMSFGSFRPVRMSFEHNERKAILTDWVSWRMLKDKQVVDLKNTLRTARSSGTSISGDAEEALKLLLGFR